MKRRFNKIRNAILTHLDKIGWPWNPHLSNLLDQIDSIIFGMRYGT
jgi:hypothetical protein